MHVTTGSGAGARLGGKAALFFRARRQRAAARRGQSGTKQKPLAPPEPRESRQLRGQRGSAFHRVGCAAAALHRPRWRRRLATSLSTSSRASPIPTQSPRWSCSAPSWCVACVLLRVRGAARSPCFVFARQHGEQGGLRSPPPSPNVTQRFGAEASVEQRRALITVNEKASIFQSRQQ